MAISALIKNILLHLSSQFKHFPSIQYIFKYSNIQDTLNVYAYVFGREINVFRGYKQFIYVSKTKLIYFIIVKL